MNPEAPAPVERGSEPAGGGRRLAIDLLTALSLANLCYLSIWRELLFATGGDLYWLPDHTAQTFQAIVINVLALGALLYGVIALLVRSPRPWLAGFGRLIFLAAFVFPLNYLRLVVGVNHSTVVWLQDHWWLSLPAAVTCAAIGLYLLVFRLNAVARVLGVVCLILSPFAFMTLAQAAWAAITLSSDQPGPVVQAAQEPRPKQRILWLVMDELDLRLTFLERPDGLVLPAFDGLRAQALFATDTVSHSLDTKEAIPSFLLQKIVKQAQPVGAGELHVRFQDFEQAEDGDFAGMANFFTEAAALGARIAVLGLYHPYCRLVGDQTDYCRSYTVTTYAPLASDHLGQEIWSQIRGISPLFRRANAIQIYRDSAEEIRRLAADPNYDVVYMHASVPHGPNIWDAEAGRFTLLNLSKTGYFDSLVLADRLLDSIRSSMTQVGLWDSTAVLVTSDHEWRLTHFYDGRRTATLPFVLKMPGQTSAQSFEQSFAPMQVTKDLLLEILTGRLSTAPEAAAWLRGRLAEMPKS